jgi:hypothetical protein
MKWTPEKVSLFATLSDAAIAQQLELSVIAVKTRRKRERARRSAASK